MHIIQDIHSFFFLQLSIFSVHEFHLQDPILVGLKQEGDENMDDVIAEKLFHKRAVCFYELVSLSFQFHEKSTFTYFINSAPNKLSVSLKTYACRIIQGRYHEAIQDCETGKYQNVSCWLYLFHIGGFILTSLFTFLLVCIRLCVQKETC